LFGRQSVTLNPRRLATIAEDGWTLVSAEARHAEHPGSFVIPELKDRDSLTPGDAAKLLFDIETREGGRVIDRGVDRMWVIVKRRIDDNYIGVLESNPGISEGLTLRPGIEVLFRSEHISDIGHPPRSYIVDKYGAEFFAE
jgi:hypothetical protein